MTKAQAIKKLARLESLSDLVSKASAEREYRRPGSASFSNAGNRLDKYEGEQSRLFGELGCFLGELP